MLISELRVALQKYNINMSGSVIRRLASDGVISPPPRYPKGEGKGRGGPSDWPEQSIGEIVAFWVLTHNSLFGATPKSTIRKMRQEWYRLIDRPEEALGLSVDEVGVHGGNSFLFSMQFEHKLGLDLICRQPVARWVATVQKVQDKRPIDKPIWLLYYWMLRGDQSDRVFAIFKPPPIVREPFPEDQVHLALSARTPPRNLGDKEGGKT
jgi:hypothetical protein